MSARATVFALLCVCGSAAAQEPEPRPLAPVERLEVLTGEAKPERDEIETDRDSFTPATTVVGRNRLVVESAYTFLDNRGIKETHSFPELLFRYGIAERLEFRFGWNYEVGGAGNSATGADAADEDPTAGHGSLLREYTLLYGFKAAITTQDRWRPRSAVILHGYTPTGGSAGTSPSTQVLAAYIVGWELPNRWKFDTALRYGTASEDGDHFHQWAPSAVLKVPLGEKWAVHGEYFGIATTGKAENGTQHYFSPGVHYLVTPNFEVGVRLGCGLNDQSSRFFANVGVGGRF